MESYKAWVKAQVVQTAKTAQQHTSMEDSRNWNNLTPFSLVPSYGRPLPLPLH